VTSTNLLVILFFGLLLLLFLIITTLLDLLETLLQKQAVDELQVY